MSRVFGHPIAKCCDMLGVAGSSLNMVKFFIQHVWMLRMMLHMFGQVRATMLHHGMLASSIYNNQQAATGLPKACNILSPMMLRYVALKCCDRLVVA